MGAVAIIDYGAGNLESVRKAVELVGGESIIVNTPDQLRDADRFILPGVGAAGKALASLRRSGFAEALNEIVRAQARPFLGICLGMQILAERHFEFGEHQGLGWVGGDIVHLENIIGSDLRVPHMGWNEISVDEDATDGLFDTIRGRREFYFAHSYALAAHSDSKVVGTTDYGIPIPAVIVDQTVLATQFHPEKSQVNGEKLLAAFLDWMP